MRGPLRNVQIAFNAQPSLSPPEQICVISRRSSGASEYRRFQRSRRLYRNLTPTWVRSSRRHATGFITWSWGDMAGGP
jgi:hypothetical protein